MQNIPTIQDLYNQIISDFDLKLGTNLNQLRRAYLKALAAVQAGKLKIMYLFAAAVQKNIAPDTADTESNGGTLERFGRLKLNRNPFPAVQGVYECFMPAFQEDVLVPVNTTFKSTSGKMYILDEGDAEFSPPGGHFTVRALEAGTEAQLNIGDTLTCTIPLAGTNGEATTTDVYTTPQDAETIEDYRAKVEQAYRLEPQGGAAGDYRLWASDVQGVKTIYPYTQTAYPGVVTIYVEATEAAATDGYAMPPAGMLTDVEASIIQDPDISLPVSERSRKPITVFGLNINAIIYTDVLVTINGYNDLTAEKETIISNAIVAECKKIRPYIGPIDDINDRNDTVSTAKIMAAIMNAIPNSILESITLDVNGNTVNNYLFDNGRIPDIPVINFVA